MQFIKDWILPIISGLILLATFATAVIKPLRTCFKSWFRKKAGSDAIDEKLTEQTNIMKDILSSVKKLESASQSTLRSMMTDLYNRRFDDKALTVEEKKNLISLYENYKNLGGNHYIDEIYREMIDTWDVWKR